MQENLIIQSISNSAKEHINTYQRNKAKANNLAVFQQIVLLDDKVQEIEKPMVRDHNNKHIKES